MARSKQATNRNITLRIIFVWWRFFEAQLRPRPENEAVRRPSVVEHAELLASRDALPAPHADLARRHFSHPDGDEAQYPEARVVGLDKNERLCGDGGQVALRLDEHERVQPLREAEGRRSLREIATGHVVCADDAAADGGVPPVIAERGEVRLVDGTAAEARGEWIVVDHVEQGVRLALEPEAVLQLDAGGEAPWGRLARVNNNSSGRFALVRVVPAVKSVNGPDARLEFAGEKMIPRREAEAVSVRWVRGIGRARRKSSLWCHCFLWLPTQSSPRMQTTHHES